MSLANRAKKWGWDLFCQHSQSWHVNEADLREDRNKGNQSYEKIKYQKFGRVWGWKFPYLSPLEITRKCEHERSKSFFSLLSQTTVGIKQDSFQLMAFQSHWSTHPEEMASDEAVFLNTTFMCPHSLGEKRRVFFLPYTKAWLCWAPLALKNTQDWNPPVLCPTTTALWLKHRLWAQPTQVQILGPTLNSYVDLSKLFSLLTLVSSS